MFVATLQMFEQQSKSLVQKPPVGLQQLQLCGAGPESWQCAAVPSGRRHAALHADPCAHGSHGAGHWFGLQKSGAGHAWLVEHGIVVQAPFGPAVGSKQVPQSQCPVALQLAFGTVLQPVGHWWLVLKHAAPGHSQQTGGAAQAHLPGATSAHCDPAGAVDGHPPTQAPVAGENWQTRVVVVVDVEVVVVVVVDALTTILSAGAQIICGWPTGTFCSVPNWSRRITWMPFGKAVSFEQSPLGQVFAFTL